MRLILGTPRSGFDPQQGGTLNMGVSWISNAIPCFPGGAPQALPDAMSIFVTYSNNNSQAGGLKLQGTSSSSPGPNDWTDIPGQGQPVPNALRNQPAVFFLTSAAGLTAWNQVRVVYTSISSNGLDTAFIRVYSAAA